MAKRKVSTARSRASKRVYKRRQRQEAIKEMLGTAVGLIPSVGIIKTVHDLSKSYDKLQRNR